MQKITIKHQDGLCWVPLANSDKSAVLDELDLEELIIIGVPLDWKFTNGYVWVSFGSTKVSIARLILDASKNHKVLFLDRDPLNMRKENLIRAPGYSKFKARDCIIRLYRQDRFEVEHDVR